jgi:hypothetical protein
MSNDNSQGLCQQVEEQIGSVLSGEADEALLEHIASCDRCRDLRHDATLAAQAIESSGSDYLHPADFDQRLFEQLASRSASAADPSPPRVVTELGAGAAPPAAAVETSATPAPTPAASTQPMAQPVAAPAAPTAAAGTQPMEQPVAAPAAPTAAAGTQPMAQPVAATGETAAADGSPAVAASAQPHAQPFSAGVRIGTALRTRNAKRVALSALGVGAIAAAAALALHLGSKGHGLGTDPMASGSWSAQIVAIARVAGDGSPGLQLCQSDGSGCVSASEGGNVKPGSLLRTDARTRAHLELSDGSRVALDRSTDLAIADKGRVAKMRRGAVVADVMHLEQGPGAKFELPVGSVEVLGTKIAMTATEDRASVEVVRGIVRLEDSSGASVTVRAGEEGTLQRGRSPEVSAVTTMADSVAWSERAEGEKGEPEMQVRGLGELRARKPGETSERSQAVRLARHDLKVRVVDSVVRTEIDESFTNDTADVLEGIYRFPLPPDAQIERLALEVNGKLEDGAFVDRDRAAAIWRGVIHNAAPMAAKPREEIIWVPGPWRDPALLEWQRGGRFELKIFPIPARGSRRVVLAYTQTIPPSGGVRRYTYPLSYDPSGSTRVGEFNVDVQVRGMDPAFSVRSRGYELKTESDNDRSAARLSMNAKSFVPSGDLTLEYVLPGDKLETTAWAYKPASGVLSSGADAASSTLGDSSYVAIALRPKLPRWAEGRMREDVIVVDSSRSMFGERYSRATRLAEAMVAEMDKRDRVSVMACDIDCRVLPSDQVSPGSGGAKRVSSFLSGIEPDGATDLVAAVRKAREVARPSKDRELRIIYIGDGGPSAGPVRPSHVRQEIARALPEGEGTLTAVAVGSDADSHVLAAMARGAGGVLIPYVPGERASSVAMQVLSATYGMALRNPVIELPQGLTDVHPMQLDTIRAGGETYVVARMQSPEITGNIKLKGKVGGDNYEQTYPIRISASTSEGNAFVPRLYAATKIEDLEANQGESAKSELIDLSKNFAVASSYTSLLVLESPAMFKAFGVERSNSSVASWSGEQSTESTSADGDTAYDDAEKNKDKMDRSGPGRARAQGHASAYDAYSADESEISARGPRGADMGGGALAGGAPARKSEASQSDWAAPPSERRKAPPASPQPATVAPPAATATMATPPAKSAPARPRDNWGRPMVAMKRVWDRNGSVLTDTAAARTAAVSKLGQLESDLNANLDSRTRLEALLGAYSYTGQLDRAAQLADRWSGRDALDPGALTARATLAARQGDRTRAIRILSGLVDLRPSDASLQNWLASMFDSMGQPQRACSHRVALAELRSSDPGALAAAVRCSRGSGSSALGDSLVADITKDTVRSAVERELAKSVEAGLKGDVQIEASWDTDADVDVALIGSKGERYSWMGDPRARCSARGATSRRSETLAVQNAPAGDYILEVTRADRDSSEPVRGTLVIRAVGTTRSIPFVLTADRVEIGTVKVFYTSHLVPVNNW